MVYRKFCDIWRWCVPESLINLMSQKLNSPEEYCVYAYTSTNICNSLFSIQHDFDFGMQACKLTALIHIASRER